MSAITLLKQAQRMIRDQDMGGWNDGHDSVVLAAIEQELASLPVDAASPVSAPGHVAAVSHPSEPPSKGLTGVVLLTTLGMKWIDENQNVPAEQHQRWVAFAEHFVERIDALGDSDAEAYRFIDAALSWLEELKP